MVRTSLYYEPETGSLLLSEFGFILFFPFELILNQLTVANCGATVSYKNICLTLCLSLALSLSRSSMEWFLQRII